MDWEPVVDTERVDDAFFVPSPRMSLGEAPLYRESDSTLHWVDVFSHPPALYVLPIRVDGSAQNGGARIVTLPEDQSVSVACFRENCPGSYICGYYSGIAFLDEKTGKLDILKAIVPPEQYDNLRMNDGACDAKGRFWLAEADKRSMARGVGAVQSGNGAGRLWRYDPDGTLTQMESGLVCGNGVAWSPDNQTMYLDDSVGQTTFAYDFNLEKGTISNKRVLIDRRPGGPDHGGEPDGMVVDSEGNLWIAVWGSHRLMMFDSLGKKKRDIAFPAAKPTCPAWGGKDYDTLFITSARDNQDEDDTNDPGGAIFALKVRGAHGQAKYKFVMEPGNGPSGRVEHLTIESKSGRQFESLISSCIDLQPACTLRSSRLLFIFAPVSLELLLRADQNDGDHMSFTTAMPVPTMLVDRTDKGTFPFLRLPGELKNEIYMLAIAPNKLAGFSIKHDAKRGFHTGELVCKPNVELLQTCRSIHQEGVPMLYATRFEFFDFTWIQLHDFLMALGRNRKLISSMGISNNTIQFTENEAISKTVGILVSDCTTTTFEVFGHGWDWYRSARLGPSPPNIELRLSEIGAESLKDEEFPCDQQMIWIHFEAHEIFDSNSKQTQNESLKELLNGYIDDMISCEGRLQAEVETLERYLVDVGMSLQAVDPSRKLGSWNRFRVWNG